MRAAIQQAKRARGKRFGLGYYDKLTDAQLTDSWATGYFPNVQIGMHPEGVFIMRFLPHATDPERFYYDNMTMFRYVDDPGYSVPGWMGLPAGSDVTGDTRPDIERVPVDVRPNLGEVLDQDVELVAAVQRGIEVARLPRPAVVRPGTGACATSSEGSIATSTARSRGWMPNPSGEAPATAS